MNATATKSTKIDSLLDCPRCSGRGYIDAFRHIKNGLCFLCAGEKQIKATKRYPKSDRIVCTVVKGFTSLWNETFTNLTYEYREAISISFDGGNSTEFAQIITEENKASMRAIWLWCKANGAEMIVDASDRPDYR